jgi:hypothetical protein
MTTYGQKGGEGPTRDKHPTTYVVELPDGSTVRKRSFSVLTNPVGYAYQHNNVWYCATVNERDYPPMHHYTQVPAKEIQR